MSQRLNPSQRPQRLSSPTKVGQAREFKETVEARAARDATFREALLVEAVAALLYGDVDAGNAMIRDCISATVGFEKLGRATKTSPKSLMRMFGPDGNPQARNLFAVIRQLQKRTGVKFEVRAA
jgi:DNA-binding phage protein